MTNLSANPRIHLTSLKVLSRAKGEFLRFSDFRGRSNQQEFWSLSLVYYANIVLLLLLGTYLQSNPVNYTFQALLIFLQVPFAAVVIRRLQDISQVRYLIDKIATRGRVMGITQRIGNTILVIAVTALWLGLVPKFGLFFYLFLALVGVPASDTMNRGALTAKPSGLSAPSPPPPLPGASSIQMQTFSVPKFRRNDLIKTPKKRLSHRFLFWFSLLAALIFLLIALFPGLMNRTIQGFEFPNLRSSVSQTPTPIPTESTSPTPSATPTDEFADNPTGSVGTDVDSDSPDAGVVVGLDPRFQYCTHAIAAGYGPYTYGVDPEYAWYRDRDGDGVVCER